MLRAGESAGDLWAKAAELERDFAGYKRRLADRRALAAAVTGRDGAEEEEQRSAGEGAAARGRRYDEYVRRRDERLRQEWRARMELKEAEMKALWARLDRGGGSRSRRGGDGELPPTSRRDRDQDYVHLQQKPWSLEVKVKPTAPAMPTSRPATASKLSRSRTSVPSSPAAAPSPKLSTPDSRRRHLHRHLPPAEPPATPRKENRLPPPSTLAAAAPATPRPRTALSRSRSMAKDSRYPSGRESPRPPRFQLQPPRTSCDGVRNIKEAPLSSPDHDDDAGVVQSRPCFSEHAAVFAHLKKACGVATEPFQLGRSAGGGAEPASPPLVTQKDQPGCSDTAPPPAGCNAGNKCNNDRDVHQSSESGKSASPDITGDSDTEPSYVYIKRDRGEQTPSSAQVSAGPGTCPQAEQRSEDKKESCDFEDTMASSEANTVAGESPMADAEEASRRASSESLYSNVRSSFSQPSELDISATNSPLRSPRSCATPPGASSPVDENAGRREKNPEEDGVEKSIGSGGVTVSITIQSPMDAMAGLKRFLTFGKKSNAKAGEVATAVIERPPRSPAPAPPACDRSSNAGVPDDLDCSNDSPHVRSLQSITPFSSANHELKEAALHVKSPRVHRSFFSLSSFKSRAS